MADGSLSIKRSITVRAVVTPRWKEDAEREISNAIAGSDGQLAQLEQEGQQLVDAIRSQSANPLDPRVQDQVASVQERMSAWQVWPWWSRSRSTTACSPKPSSRSAIGLPSGTRP